MNCKIKLKDVGKCYSIPETNFNSYHYDISFIKTLMQSGIYYTVHYFVMDNALSKLFLFFFFTRIVAMQRG